jgi:3-deoxy-7-phosphoheptulonate synthase
MMNETMNETNGPSNGSTPSWSPDSWRNKPIKQAPDYPDKGVLSKSVAELKRLPPIVHPREIVRLKEHLRDVARGEAFLLQGGDCAELFAYCEQNAIESKIKLLLQMSLVLIWGADKRVVRIGRMAGQYAKPRSSPMETVDGKQVPSFRGDILNGFPLDERELDPGRLVK